MLEEPTLIPEPPTLTPTDPPTLTPTDVPTSTPSETATESPSLTVTLAEEASLTPTDAALSTTPAETATATAEPSLTPTSSGLPTEEPLSLLFTDNFDSGNLALWTLGPGWGLIPNGSGQALQTLTDAPLSFVHNTLTNVAVEVKFMQSAGSFRLTINQTAEGSYQVEIKADGMVGLYRSGLLIGSAQVSPAQAGVWRSVRLSAMQNLLRVMVDGSEVITAFEPSPLAAGTFSVSGGGLGADGLTVDAVAVWVMPSAVMTGTVAITPTQDMMTPTLLPDAAALAPDFRIQPSPTPDSNLVGRESLTASFAYSPPIGSSVTVNAANVTQLRSAITQANSTCTKTTYINLTSASPYIVNDFFVTDQNFDNQFGRSGFPIIRCDIVILGNGGIIQRLASDGAAGPLFRLFSVDNNDVYPYARLTLDKVTLRYGSANAIGGSAVFSYKGTLRLRNNARIVFNKLHITSTSLAVIGAGLYSYWGRMIIEDSYIANNSNTSTTAHGGGVGFDGGAIYSNGPQLTIQRSVIELNSTRGYGAGVYVGFISGANITGTNVLNNTAAANPSPDRNGSAIYLTATGSSLISGVCMNGNAETIASNKFAVWSADNMITGAGNWWGATSGPRHPNNPGGTGQAANVNINIGNPPNFLTTNPQGSHDCRQLSNSGAGLNVVAHRNATFSDPNPVLTSVSTVDFTWEYGAPGSLTTDTQFANQNIPADYFSMRFYGTLKVPATGTYTFSADLDDGVIFYIYVNGSWLWGINKPEGPWGDTHLQLGLAAGDYPIVMDYKENQYRAYVKLRWNGPGTNVPNGSFAIIPQTNLEKTFNVAFPGAQPPQPDTNCNDDQTISLITRAQFSQIQPNSQTPVPQTKELFDMVVIQPDFGLTFLEGPTINAAANSFRGTASWGTQVVILDRVTFPQGNNDTQIWYSVRRLDNTARGYIPVRYDGVDYTAAQDPCATRFPTPPTSLTFMYDRSTAANYAIEHSYQNRGLLGTSGYPTQLGQTTIPLGTNNLSGLFIPFARFNFGNAFNTLDFTGSAIFISQAIWTGGYPMTVRNTNPSDCANEPIQQNAGWRYCVDGSYATTPFSSNPFDNHQELVSYYTTYPFPPNNVPPGNDTLSTKGQLLLFGGNAFLDGGPSAQPGASNTVHGLSSYIPDLTAGLIRANQESALSQFIATQLPGNPPLQAGDYILMDFSTVGDHGLFVVGWQQALNCDDAMGIAPSTRRWRITDFRPTYAAALASPGAIPNPVPYVADFAELRYTTPRPFYCSARIVSTTPVRPGKAAYFNPHNWYFFGLPNASTLPLNRISVPLNWNW